MKDIFEAIKAHSYNDVEECLKAGVNPNIEDRLDSPALCRAAALNDTAICKLLVEYGADVNGYDGDRSDPLSFAIVRGNLELCKFFVEKGANLGPWEVRWAAHCGHLDVFKYLLENVEVDDIEKVKGESLIDAASDGQIEICEFLLQNGVDINYQDARGNTALMLAAHENYLATVNGVEVEIDEKKLKMVEYLIEHGADVNIRNKDGFDAYFHARSKEINIALTPKAVSMRKEDAIQYSGWLHNIDEAVEVLTYAREQGKNLWFDFNGHKLYSADVTLDSAYIEVLGMDKATYEKKQKEWREEYARKKKEEEEAAQAKIPYWKEEGKKYIPQPLWEEWEKCVEIRAGDLYHGKELDSLLDILKAIDKGKAKTADDVEKILGDQNHSGSSYGIMKSMLKTFSPAYNELPTDKESD